MDYYTVFDRNDEILAFGDANECAQKVGFKNVRQFYAFVSKTKSGLYKYNSVVVDKDFETETVMRKLDEMIIYYYHLYVLTEDIWRH